MKLLRLNDPGTPKEMKIRGAPDYMCIDPKTGFYWYDIYRSDKSPQRLCRSTKTRNKELAKRLAEESVAKWLGEKADGSKPRYLFSYVTKKKIEQMEAGCRAKNKPRRGTVDNAKIFFAQLDNEFGHLYVDQINQETTWGGFVARTQRDNQNKPLYNLWKHMSLAMNYAFKCGYVNKFWKVENPDPEFREQRLLTAAEVASIYGAAKQNLKDQMLFATTMGMRKREHLKLSWKSDHCCHVDMNEKTVSVCAAHNKNGKARTIPMSRQVFAMLLRRKEGYYRHGRSKSDMWVFPSRGNAAKPAHDNKTAWNNAKRDAGVKDADDCKYHLLRHYFLSTCAKLVKEGHVSMVLVCKYADVSIRTFERRYLHVRPTDMIAVAGMVAVELRDCDISLEVKH